MIKYFACSDIHSFYDEWMLALTNYGFDKTNPDHKVIVCGDLFDRGPQSRECFEFVKTLHSQDRLIYVKGNHEELLFDCVHALNKRRKKERSVIKGELESYPEALFCLRK